MELVVGRVVKSHGVTGEVVVEIRTDDPADRFAPGTRLRAKGPFDGGAEGSAVSYVIESVRQHGGRCWCDSLEWPIETQPMRCAAACS